MQFLVHILPLGSGSVDPQIFAGPDPGSQNLADPTDPDPKHWFSGSQCFNSTKHLILCQDCFQCLLRIIMIWNMGTIWTICQFHFAKFANSNLQNLRSSLDYSSHISILRVCTQLQLEICHQLLSTIELLRTLLNIWFPRILLSLKPDVADIAFQTMNSFKLNSH